MAVKPVAYDKILTAKDWDKNKGTFAKAAGKTGMGAALKELEKAFAAIDWKKLSVSDQSPLTASVADVDNIYEDVKKEYAKTVENARAKAKDVRDLAGTTAKKFKSNKMIPKSSTAHVEKLGKTADLLFVSLNKNSLGEAIGKDYQGMRDSAKKREEILNNKLAILKKYVKSAGINLKKVKTKSDFTNVWSEDLRGVGTQLPMFPTLKPFLKPWREITSQAGTVETDEDAQRRAGEVFKVLKRLNVEVEKLS